MRLIFLFVLVCSQLNAEVSWKNAPKQKASWYETKEANELADKVMLYQRENGGWPKNEDMSAKLSKDERKKLLKIQADPGDTTIDNGATFTPLKFLIKIWKSKTDPTTEASIHRGLTFLLESQYPNGGWPQRPHDSGYGRHITYNDGAMIGVMIFLRDLLEESPAFLTETEKAKIKTALVKGLDCILKTQILVNGKPTVWCAQHDHESLLPVKARSYEHPSFSGGESAGIIKYLMQLKAPSPEVRASIEAAISWLRDHQIEGLRIKKTNGNKVIVKDTSAPILWARFYDLKTAKPLFSGRDGIMTSSLAEIEAERRNGYAWYVSKPRALLKDYPEWQESHKK